MCTPAAFVTYQNITRGLTRNYVAARGPIWVQHSDLGSVPDRWPRSGTRTGSRPSRSGDVCPRSSTETGDENRGRSGGRGTYVPDLGRAASGPAGTLSLFRPGRGQGRGQKGTGSVPPRANETEKGTDNKPYNNGMFCITPSPSTLTSSIFIINFPYLIVFNYSSAILPTLEFPAIPIWFPVFFTKFYNFKLRKITSRTFPIKSWFSQLL